MKYWIETYGCQMNKAESDALIIELERGGYRKADSPENASLVLINTCSVRKTAEDRIVGRIGYYKRIKKNNNALKVVVTGCMAERLGEKLKGKNSPVDEVFGTFEKRKIIDYALNRDFFIDRKNEIYEFPKLHAIEGEFKAFLPIMNGCNNFCSYCIVPYVRGREISRNPDDVFREIEMLEEMKFREVTLIGQNVNSYCYGTRCIVDFPDLLEKISSQVGSIEWIRFLTSHPKDLSEKLIDVMAGSGNVCRHLHLPVQSGSSRILQKMNRKYSAEYYMDLVSRIRKKIPEISLTTDIIVGFPGETEQDFNDTFTLMKEVGFRDAFTYYYNPREGTDAFSYGDDIATDVKLQRLSEIIELQRNITNSQKRKMIGMNVKVLAESVSKKNENELLGRTETDEMIVFPGKSDKIGLMLDVKITSLAGNTFTGEIA